MKMKVRTDHLDNIAESRKVNRAPEDEMRCLSSSKAYQKKRRKTIAQMMRFQQTTNLHVEYGSESFPSKTVPFSLKKVRLVFEQFNKAQMSHRHATDAPPTHHRRILYVISLNSGQRVG